MPFNFPQEIGGLGEFNGEVRQPPFASDSDAQKALESWVATKSTADYLEITAEEEDLLYESSWLQHQVQTDPEINDEWVAFSNAVPKHKLQAIAFVSWYLHRDGFGDRNNIRDVVIGYQWQHPTVEVLACISDQYMYIICNSSTVVIPLFAIDTVTMKQGFSEGRIIFSGDPEDRTSFGIDKIKNVDLQRFFDSIDPLKIAVKPGSIEDLAVSQLGEGWRRWRPALDALSTGFGHPEYRVNLADSPMLFPARIGGAMWTPPSREFFQKLLDEANFGVFIGVAKISLGNDFDYEPEGESELGPEWESGLLGPEWESELGPEWESELGPDRYVDVMGSGLRVPIAQSPPDVWRDPARLGFKGGMDPWDVLEDERPVLLAISDKGIWRIPQDGCGIYFNPWTNVASAEVFTGKNAASAGDADLFMLSGPQQPLQLAMWNYEARREIRKVFDKLGDPLDPVFLSAMLQADWMKVDKSFGKKLTSRLEKAMSLATHPSEEELVERVQFFSDLETLGMGWAELSLFEEDSWVVRDFDCPGCGRMASTTEGIRVRRAHLAALQEELGELQNAVGLAKWFRFQVDKGNKVKPAQLQREFDFSYELSVRVLKTFRDLDIASPTRCERCVEKQMRKEVGGASGDRTGLPATLRFQVLQASGFRCHYCGRGANSTPPVELEVDHIVPVAAGGQDDLGNLQASCRDCNRGKSASSVI